MWTVSGMELGVCEVFVRCLSDLVIDICRAKYIFVLEAMQCGATEMRLIKYSAVLFSVHKWDSEDMLVT